MVGWGGGLVAAGQGPKSPPPSGSVRDDLYDSPLSLRSLRVRVSGRTMHVNGLSDVVVLPTWECPTSFTQNFRQIDATQIALTLRGLQRACGAPAARSKRPQCIAPPSQMGKSCLSRRLWMFQTLSNPRARGVGVRGAGRCGLLLLGGWEKRATASEFCGFIHDTESSAHRRLYLMPRHSARFSNPVPDPLPRPLPPCADACTPLEYEAEHGGQVVASRAECPSPRGQGGSEAKKKKFVPLKSASSFRLL